MPGRKDRRRGADGGKPIPRPVLPVNTGQRRGASGNRRHAAHPARQDQQLQPLRQRLHQAVCRDGDAMGTSHLQRRADGRQLDLHASPAQAVTGAQGLHFLEPIS